MLRNPRDEAGRVLCLTCGKVIVTERTMQAGRLAYLVACPHPFVEGERQWPW